MYDIIIIGGGPAGASAGRRAGMLGLNTLLLEKEEFPRYKPCAGGLSNHAASYLGFELPKSVINREITGARVLYKDRAVEVRKDYRLSLMVSRSIFDNFLLEKAKESGITVHTGEKVLSCSEKPEYVEVKTLKNTYLSKFLIIAEGVQGLLKTCVRPADTKEEYGVCMVTEVPALEEEIEKRLGKNVELHFGIAEGGYGWIFPHKNYYSVGIGGGAKILKHPKKRMLAFLEANGFTGEYKLHGHKIPWGGLKRKVCGSRTLLCGDSAGFVDSFSGEGLAYAIRSGQLAAEVLGEICLKKEEELKGKMIPDLKKYEALCQEEFGVHLKYSLMFSRTMHKFPDKAFGIFTSNEKFLDKYLEVMNFKMNYKDYLRWTLLHLK